MEFQLRRLDEEDDEHERAELAGKPMHIANIKEPDLGIIRVQAIPLPRELPGWLRASRNRMRVYHAVNGQVQYKRGRDYISGPCKLPGLKDRAVIIVDASDLIESAHNHIWKGDRETIRQTKIGAFYEKKITDEIRGSTALKQLEERIKNEETEQLAKEAQTNLFQSVVLSDPHIAQLLPGGTVVRLPGRRAISGGEAKEYEGRYSPTFVKLVAKSLRDSGVEIAINQRRRIRFETDAGNDWLTRPDNRGNVRFVTRGTEAGFGFSAELINGSLSVTIQAAQNQVSVGETLNTEIWLIDDSMPSPVSSPVVFRIVESRQQPEGGRRRSHRGKADDGDEPSDGRGLPTSKWITKDGRPIGDEDTRTWAEFDFTDQDGGFVHDLSADEKLYFINYDNAHFQHFLTGERREVDKQVLTEQYRLSMLVLMMGFEDAYARLSGPTAQVEWAGWVDEFRRYAAQGAATVVMSIAKTLPKLITADTVGDPDDS